MAKCFDASLFPQEATTQFDGLSKRELYERASNNSRNEETTKASAGTALSRWQRFVLSALEILTKSSGKVMPRERRVW